VRFYTLEAAGRLIASDCVILSCDNVAPGL
jgi:hypothetical protein